ncbi:unnamed protein product [Parascedosporium putredinis]|uniref:SMP-30/Gluconolactonase/LRE-like region domain-containing protein n=1 Tax=Parascedosporium putredinis TaxID=1442378 RepID=A0A9P1GW80_9PEZI|nr:unnamed protein product [Parascedosporium putredinis]CAI7988160.1 unnamed protein product [Parascedosporium putredinis]
MRFQSLFTLFALPAVLAGGNRPGSKVSVIYETDTVGPWFENLVVRPSGTILATRMDDPGSGTSTPAARPALTPDVYVFNAGNFSLALGGFVPGSLAVWKVDLTVNWGHSAPVPERVASLPDALFLNGIARWDDTRVLVGDIVGNVVYLLDVTTGDFDVAIDIPETTLVNGIRVHDDTVYFVSGAAGSIYRLPVDADALPTGPAQLIAADLNLDDFDMADDGTIYAAAVWSNQLLKVTQAGAVTVLAGGPNSVKLLSCTSARLGRTRKDRNTVYLSTMGNGAFPSPGDVTTEAKIVAVKV